jgi:hypothetical protein
MCTVKPSTPFAAPPVAARPRPRRPLPAPSKSRKASPPSSPTMASSGGISDQLFVSVKMEGRRLAELDLGPHLIGSHPVAGSWDPCKAVSSGSPRARAMCLRAGFDAFGIFSLQLPMERAATAVWELSCILPSQHGELCDLIVWFGHSAGDSVY